MKEYVQKFKAKVIFHSFLSSFILRKKTNYDKKNFFLLIIVIFVNILDR